MATSKTTLRDRGWKKLHKRLSALSGGGAAVEVGFFDPANASIAVIHEHGAPGANIPERSFLRSTFDEERPALERQLAEGVEEVFKGRATLERILMNVGDDLADKVHRKILGMNSPANAPSTVAKKGFDDPLVETGAMADAVEARLKR